MLRQYNCICISIARVLMKHCGKGIYIAGPFSTNLSQRRRVPHIVRVASQAWVNMVRNIFPESATLVAGWSHRHLQWLPSYRPLYHCHRKVTGSTQKSVITVNRIRKGLVSACSMEMLGAHDVCVCVCLYV